MHPYFYTERKINAFLLLQEEINCQEIFDSSSKAILFSIARKGPAYRIYCNEPPQDACWKGTHGPIPPVAFTNGVKGMRCTILCEAMHYHLFIIQLQLLFCI